MCTSSYMPQPEDSGGHSHPCLFADASFLASSTLKPSPTPTCISKLYQLSGYTVTPTAYKILCVRFVWFVRRISPCKVHQASLGALTTKLCGANEAKRSLRPNERIVRRCLVMHSKYPRISLACL